MCVDFIARYRKTRSTWISSQSAQLTLLEYFAIDGCDFLFKMLSQCFSCSAMHSRATDRRQSCLRTLTSFECFLADVHLVHLGGFKIPASSKIQPQCKFPCPKCSSIFSRKNNLYSHMKFECGQLPRFGCPYCEYASKKSSNIRAHVRRIHCGYKVDVIHVPLL